MTAPLGHDTNRGSIYKSNMLRSDVLLGGNEAELCSSRKRVKRVKGDKITGFKMVSRG